MLMQVNYVNQVKLSFEFFFIVSIYIIHIIKINIIYIFDFIS